MNEAQNTPVIQKIINDAIQKTIQHDPDSVKKLKPFAGKIIKIIIKPIDLNLYLHILEDSINVTTDCHQDVDTTIEGKPTALFAMGTNQHIPGLDSITINGDASTGQFIANWLKNLKPDWEEAICDVFGDGPGYRISESLKGLKQFGEKLGNSLFRSSKEYLLEENRELVSAHEMEQFLDGVDDLKSDLVILERKIDSLYQAK